jgi:metallo-beta-lactamase class B
LLSAHPFLADTFGKAAARTPQRNPFIDAEGCRSYAATASKLLGERLARERTSH